MGLVLRYVARFDANGKARVGVEAVREDHPLASLLPCDNVFAIEPLVSRQPAGDPRAVQGATSPPGRFSRILTGWRSCCSDIERAGSCQLCCHLNLFPGSGD